MTDFSDHDLDAFLDEALPAAEMARLEQQLRDHPELLSRLASIRTRRDSGVHSLGEIWRRHRLTCPSRSQWGSYLLRVLPEAEAAYFRFHVETMSCRWCQANLVDLQQQRGEPGKDAEKRRTKYFQSSAGYLTPTRGK
jgi:hypothetical protein